MAKETKYVEAIGRRKSATARVRLTPTKNQSIRVNKKPIADYFHSKTLESVISGVFTALGKENSYEITAQVKGGGLSSQAEAVRLGIARALVDESRELRTPLKKAGYLKRDPRSKERRKFGLKKARKSAQWSKR